MQLNIFSAVHHDNISFGATVAASVLRDQNIQYLRVETHRKAIQSSEITVTSYSNVSGQINCINDNKKKMFYLYHTFTNRVLWQTKQNQDAREAIKQQKAKQKQDRMEEKNNAGCQSEYIQISILLDRIQRNSGGGSWLGLASEWT